MSNTKTPALSAKTVTSNMWFVLLICLSALVARAEIASLVSLVGSNGDSSYVAIIPLISGCLIWWDRHGIFHHVKRSLRWLLAFVLAISVTAVVAMHRQWFATSQDYIAAMSLPLVASWLAAFIVCYGTGAFRRALFPLLFLLWTVPLPTPLLAAAITELQRGSASATYALFSVLGVPVLRDGMLLHLAGISVEVARECSGIRSSLVLLILSLLLCHFSLRTWWARSLLLVTVVPISIVKNAVRIVTLVMLSIHVDPSFLTGSLHQKGGVLFMLGGLLLIGIEMKLLQIVETKAGVEPTAADSQVVSSAVLSSSDRL